MWKRLRLALSYWLAGDLKRRIRQLDANVDSLAREIERRRTPPNEVNWN